MGIALLAFITLGTSWIYAFHRALEFCSVSLDHIFYILKSWNTSNQFLLCLTALSDHLALWKITTSKSLHKQQNIIFMSVIDIF